MARNAPVSDDLFRAGRLSQVCPDCGRAEAAGSYCTGCLRPMAAADWRRVRSEGRAAASAKGLAAKRSKRAAACLRDGLGA